MSKSSQFRSRPLVDDIVVLEKTTARLSEELGREPLPQELAIELGWDESKIEAVSNFSLDKDEMNEDFEFRFRLTVKNHEMEKRRLALNMMQKELGKLVGVDSQKITSIECMRYFPDTELQKKIANALHTTTDAIFPEWLQSYSERWMRADREKIVKMKTLSLDSPDLLSLPAEIQAPEEYAHEKVEKKIIEEILDSLSPREQSIIEMRFGLRGTPQGTLDDVARVFNVGRERIRQIEAKALERMREHPSLKKLYV